MKTFNITYEQKGNSFVKGIHIEATSFGEMEEKFNKLNLGTLIGCIIVNQKIMKGVAFAINVILVILNSAFFFVCFADNSVGKEMIFISLLIYGILLINLKALLEEEK